MAEKKCSKCSQVKDLESFAKMYRRTRPDHDGRRTVCRNCVGAANRERYHTRPEVAEKAKRSSHQQAAKRFTSARHRELWKAARRRYRWKRGAVPRALKQQQRAERDALSASIKAARATWRQWLLVDGTDAEVLDHFEMLGKPWLNPRLSESQAHALKYANDPEFHDRELRRLKAKKRRHRDEIAAATDDITPAETRAFLEAAKVCAYCEVDLDESNRTIDHVVPPSKGGRHARSNVVHACRSCNSRKQDLLIA